MLMPPGHESGPAVRSAVSSILTRRVTEGLSMRSLVRKTDSLHRHNLDGWPCLDATFVDPSEDN
jgi:hypothetical protein